MKFSLKSLALLTSLSLAVTLVGCGGGDEVVPLDETDVVIDTEPAPAPDATIPDATTDATAPTEPLPPADTTAPSDLTAPPISPPSDLAPEATDTPATDPATEEPPAETPPADAPAEAPQV